MTDKENLPSPSPTKMVDSAPSPPSPSEPTTTTTTTTPTPTTTTTQEQERNYRDVHMFYYPWYASMSNDGKWAHWNHQILPHWDAVTKSKYKYDIRYEPPDDIGANFYPQRGPYSSRNKTTVEEQMKEMRGYVVVVSWWGIHGADAQGDPTDSLMHLILKAAEKYSAKIAIHLEPYTGRNANTVKGDIKYIYDNYGKYSSLFRDPSRGDRIIIYVYDSYHTPAQEWATVLSKDSPNSIRGTKEDAIMLGLYLEPKDKSFLIDGKFDGFYTYFAAAGFTHGSTRSNWVDLSKWAKSQGLFFSCSLGPGYDDTRIRPWNAMNRKSRDNGKYYDQHWESALSAMPDIISITSYNEWHEGTQIEAAIPKQIENTIEREGIYSYEDYSPLYPDYYMDKTHEYSQIFMDKKNSTSSP
eukprot:TRINITY_DN2862_c2_g1_i1.p1 TRINITY_DN2862_c2_g1~~TRINITY_DN2862_c2_g1_i1.p1  ORF type:complete len:411 (-),score=115.46 TRINITY_DN2862_c2_g1_i1:45-1277(-)